ncbi:hypothetical protein L1887_40293 [Cichorium endivia]|nr:hypothetical protein L1887_40293 [Cichorium endivia]
MEMETKRIRCGQATENLARENLSLIVQQIDENPNVSDPYRRVYECKDCDKKYDTFQALGGHRASHKKVKPNDHDDGSENSSPSSTSLQKLHECKVCGLEFAIGQALGGHMRRHQGMKLENNSILEVDEHPNQVKTDDEVEEKAKYPLDRADEPQKKKNDDETAEGDNNDNLRRQQEVDGVLHDTRDELRQPAEGDKYWQRKVNSVRTEVVQYLQEKADDCREQTSGEHGMADSTKDSATPREEYQCCDLNLPPDEDDTHTEFQVRTYYCFL